MIEFTDRMMAWFTPQMLSPDHILIARLVGFAKEYDDMKEAGTLTVGDIDRIFTKSDKLQAELWRRHISGSTSVLINRSGRK